MGHFIMNKSPIFWLNGHIDVLGKPWHKYSKTSLHSLCGGWQGKNSFLGSLCWGNKPLCPQFSGLYKVITVENLIIWFILGNSSSLSRNLNFHCNPTNLEIENLEILISSLTLVQLSPSIANTRTQSSSSLVLLSVKSILLALSNLSNSTHLLQLKFFVTQRPY